MRLYSEMTDEQLQGQLEIYQYGDNQLIWEVAKRFAKRCYELNTLRQSVADVGTIKNETSSLRSELAKVREELKLQCSKMREYLNECLKTNSYHNDVEFQSATNKIIDSVKEGKL